MTGGISQRRSAATLLLEAVLAIPRASRYVRSIIVGDLERKFATSEEEAHGLFSEDEASRIAGQRRTENTAVACGACCIGR
jgi:hypothetical protein